MATLGLVDVGRQYLLDPAAFLRAHPRPWLVFLPPGTLAEDSSVTTAAKPQGVLDPETSWPVAIEIVKAAQPNLFPFGITVGRTENNDIVLRYPEISRFHSYFQEQEGQMCLADADSKNGTFLDGRRLAALKPVPLPPQALVRFGQLEVRYFEPAGLAAYLEKTSRGA